MIHTFFLRIAKSIFSDFVSLNDDTDEIKLSKIS
nr:CPPV180 hypothetical protein [Cooks petrelpox virus]